LERLLGDADVDVRLAAAVALEHYGSAARPAVPALIKALGTPEVELRLAVIRALRAIGPDANPAIPALNTALTDHDPRVRQLAAEAVDKLKIKN
jgi:HEAT repeat protein